MLSQYIWNRRNAHHCILGKNVASEIVPFTKLIIMIFVGIIVN